MHAPRPFAPAHAERQGHLTGIVLITVAFALFSVTDALMKHVARTYPLFEAFFFNALFALVPIVGFALMRGGLRTLATRRPLVHLVRSCFGVGAGLGAFYAYTRMPIADVYAILFTSPLIITALSRVFLGERVAAAQWAAILVGFSGVLAMLRPGGGMLDPGALGAMASAFCFAVSGLIVRRYGRSETAASYPFYGNLLSASVLLPLMAPVFVMPDAAGFALMAACGLCAGTALLCLLGAFRIAPAAVVAPFQYTQILWGVLYGALFFGDWPGPALWAGAAVVIGSGLYLLRREARH